MSLATAFDLDFVISGSLTPAAPIANDFRPAVVSGDSTLDGETFVIYTSAAGAQAAETAGDLSAGALAEVLGMFAQGAADVAVIKYLTATEDPSDGMTAAASAGLAWYWTVVQSRTLADIIDADTWIAANSTVLSPYVQIWQTADADAITGTPPAGDAALRASLRAWGVYEPVSAQVSASRYAGQFARIDIDTRCPSGTPQIVGGTAYDLTEPQAAFADANGYNLLLPPQPGSLARVVRRGMATPSEPVYSIISLDWYGLRAAQALVALRAGFDARNEKFPLSAGGAAMVEGQLGEVAARGLGAGHFGPLPDLVDGYSISTSIDRPARRIIAEVRLGILDAVRTVRVDYLLDR